jgi:alpha-galactosidase
MEPNMVFNFIVGGGLLNMRMFLDLARDVERHCPDAWLIQESNPVFEGCTLIHRETSIKMVGLCHGYFGVYEMARALGLDEKQVSWQAPGFNHVIYLTHFYYEGRDAYPILDRWIANEAEHYWKTSNPRFDDNQMSRAAIQQYKMLKYMPIGDTVRAGGWWYHTDLKTKQYWYGPLGGFDSPQGWDQYVAWLEETRDRMFEIARDPKASVTKAFPPEKSGEIMIPIIDALTNDAAGIFQVNIPNDGLIDGIPHDVVVEVPAYVSKRGIQGLKVGRMPESVMTQVLWPRLAWGERAVSLARYPTRASLLDAILHRHVFTGFFYAPPVRSFQEAGDELDMILKLAPMLSEIMND